MSASYPSAVKSFTPLTDGVDYPEATHLQQPYDEITAVETALLDGFAHNLIPNASATYDLGSSSLKWRDGFYSRDLTVGRNATITGTVTLNGLTYTFPASQSANAFLQTDGAGTLSFVAGSSNLVLLKANSGTDSTTSATVVDSKAISGLTAKDSILVLYTLEAVTQATAAVTLYNSTDSVKAGDLSAAGSLAAGNYAAGTAMLRQFQSGSTTIAGLTQGNSNAGSLDLLVKSTFTTAWTGSWTLALRHGGVTSGGTLKWSWAVYQVLGQ